MMRSTLMRTVMKRGAPRSAALRVTASTAPTKPRVAAAPLSTATLKTKAGGNLLEDLLVDTPHMDVVKYTHKKRTWTLQHVQYYSEALAIGILEQGFQPGDIVLSWLPEHFSEQMVLQFACSKAGVILYRLDPAVAITDKAKATAGLKAALELTKANILVSQEAGSDVNYVKLAEEVIPELRIFDTSEGAQFVTPRFPHLRQAVQTGFDQDDKWGWFRLRHLLVPAGILDELLAGKVLGPDTPLAGEFVMENDLPVATKVYTNLQVVDMNLWPTYKSILEKKFHVVEGIGVIF